MSNNMIYQNTYRQYVRCFINEHNSFFSFSSKNVLYEPLPFMNDVFYKVYICLPTQAVLLLPICNLLQKFP